MRAAWTARGFRLPPGGTKDDDWDVDHPSQRAILAHFLDDWPTELARWIAQAPDGASPYDVVAYCRRQVQAIRASVPPDPRPVRRPDGPTPISHVLNAMKGGE